MPFPHGVISNREAYVALRKLFAEVKRRLEEDPWSNIDDLRPQMVGPAKILQDSKRARKGNEDERNQIRDAKKAERVAKEESKKRAQAVQRRVKDNLRREAARLRFIEKLSGHQAFVWAG